MTSAEIEFEPIKPNELDREKGTAFDWTNWPEGVGLDIDNPDVAIEYPDRTWAEDIERMLKRDWQAQAVFTALTMPLRMANKTIEKPEGDKGQTDWLTEVLMSDWLSGGMQTPMDLVISQMTRACALKKSFHEKVWTRGKDGRIRYKKLAWRPSTSCMLMRSRSSGDMLGFKQYQDWESTKREDLDREGYITIEAKNAVVHIANQHVDSLYGDSDLNVTQWAYDLKQKVMSLWVKFADRTAIPKTIAYGKDWGQARKNAQAIAKLGSAGVVGVERPSPDEKVFEVLDATGGGTASGVYHQLMQYLDSCATRSIMASWMDLPSAAGNGAGSYALSADQSAIFMQGRFAAAKEIANTIDCQISAPLIWLNWGPDAAVPRFKFEKIDSDQTDKMLTLIQSVATAGSGPNLPQGIFDMLIENLSQYLDLDDQRVRRILEEAQRQQEEAGAQGPGSPLSPDQQKLDTAINTALGAVQAKDAGQPLPVR